MGGRIRLSQLIGTIGANWIIPARLVIGLLLMLPFGGGIQDLFAWCTDEPLRHALSDVVAFSCAMLRGLELVCAVGFMIGFVIRALAIPAMIILVLRIVSNMGASLVLGDVLLNFLKLNGDWAYGAMYFGALVVIGDLSVVGSGAYSIDRWLTQRFVSPQDP